MKKSNLIQTCIIIVGILLLYNSFAYVLQFITYIILWAEDGLRGGSYLSGLLEISLIVTAHLVSASLIIKKSKTIATAICDKAGFNEDLNIGVDKVDLLFVVFVGIGVYGLISNLPQLIKDAFYFFRKSDTFSYQNEPVLVSAPTLFIKVCTVGLFFTLVYYARVFAEYFKDKTEDAAKPQDLITELE